MGAGWLLEEEIMEGVVSNMWDGGEDFGSCVNWKSEESSRQREKRHEKEREENSFTLHFGISVLFLYSLEIKIKRAYSSRQGKLNLRVRYHAMLPPGSVAGDDDHVPGYNFTTSCCLYSL